MIWSDIQYVYEEFPSVVNDKVYDYASLTIEQ
jgi:hypothetical protein